MKPPKVQLAMIAFALIALAGAGALLPPSEETAPRETETPRTAASEPTTPAPRALKAGATRARATTVQASASRQDSLPLEEIVALLESPSRRDRWRAFQAIESYDDRPLQLALLREVVSGSDRRLAGATVALLRELGPDGVWLAVDMIPNQTVDVRVRVKLARSLRSLGHGFDDGPILDDLRGMLSNPNGARRREAVELLGELGTPGSIPCLRQALSDPNTAVRREAVGALRKSGIQAAVPILRGALNDPSPEVARRAKHALAWFKESARTRHPN
jgi:HEAT repeat protein